MGAKDARSPEKAGIDAISYPVETANKATTITSTSLNSFIRISLSNKAR